MYLTISTSDCTWEWTNVSRVTCLYLELYEYLWHFQKDKEGMDYQMSCFHSITTDSIEAFL